ncbi:MAG: carboxypeptidase regulatory-like domain-containing protein, partial [Myxococcales bacterium]|nr:carboxypeptidase regulatory-like domain-containing protein [Myxococcales bacterium]
ITGARGAQVVVPAGGLVLAVGGSVEGMVDVHLTPLDPTKPDELTAGTDAFAGRDEGGRVTLLESYGMVDVTIRQDGQKLQVAPGQTLEIRIPAPEGVTDPPATMPLWSLDEASNVWVQEGEATWDADAGVYVGQIGHMSMWNCDQPASATCITGHVADADGASLPGARITARGTDYNGSTSAVAGDDGRFYVAVRKDSSVAVLASHAAGGGTSRVVQSGSADTAVPPTPGDPRCLDVGEWVVERGVVRTSDGGTFACDIVNQNPFAGTCAAGMIDMFTCFAPSGSCTYEQMGTGATVRWSNGAGLITTQGGDRFEARYEGPGGRLCGTGGLDFNTATGETGDFAITLTNGQTYTILQDEDDTRWGVRCPSGEEVFFDRADQEALEACGVGGDSESGGISQCAGFPSAGGAGGAGGGGGQGGLCRGDAECTGGTTCCQPDPSQPEIGVCTTPAICDQIIAAQGMQ